MFHLDNILLIGATNDIDSVNPTLRQSGRIDTAIEVGLPDGQGHLQIFDIYIKLLLHKGILQADIDINYIISNSEGITGAHIEHLVHLDIRNAMRLDIVDYGCIDITYEEADQLQICNRDCMLALAEIRETYFSRKKCNHD